jgi:hypothetical protein
MSVWLVRADIPKERAATLAGCPTVKLNRGYRSGQARGGPELAGFLVIFTCMILMRFGL